MDRYIALLAAASMTGCVGAAPAAELGRTEAAIGSAEVIARPCRSDVFYVDVPLARNVPWRDHRVASVTQEAMTAAAMANPGWFCDAVGPCPYTEVEVDAAPLLPERESAGVREDGHLRFYRYRFITPDGGVVPVRPEAQCDVVATLRTELLDAAAALAVPVSADDIYVGRECDATAMGVEDVATPDMLSWHLDRVGLPASLATSPPSDPRVDVAVLDTGVDGAVAAQIGVTSSADFAGGGALHPHGTGMAVLIRQLAPEAALHSIRVLGEGGAGLGGSVARGLDHALFADADSTRPLVVNLSLGWPAELGRPAELAGEASCQTHEDPFGEPVRYMLYVADQLESREVFVSSAAGNQPRPPSPGLFPPSSAVYHDCGADPWPAQPWFAPAWYQQTDSCADGVHSTFRLGIGVGAVDDRDRPSAVSIPGMEPPLVAPGEHVYAAHPSVTSTASPPACGPTTAPATVELPHVFTGTSVSAALVSGAAARAQSAREEPFAADTLARVLYLTGETTCERMNPTSPRHTADGAVVRRLHVGRLDQALSESSCGSLLDRAQEPSDVAIGPDLLRSFAGELEACGLEIVDDEGAPVLSCAEHTSVAWPAAFPAPSDACGPTVVVAGGFVDATCPPAGCAPDPAPFQSLNGGLGPQPHDPPCPDCGLTVYGTTGVLFVDLKPDYEPGTSFSQPILVVVGPMEQTLAFNLQAYEQYFYPGSSQILQLSLLDIPEGFDWSEAKASLLVTVADGNNIPETTVSALRIE